MLSIHHIAQIRAEHNPDTHWVKLTITDRWEHDTLTLHLYINRSEDDVGADRDFAALIAEAINSIPRLPSPAQRAIEALSEEIS